MLNQPQNSALATPAPYLQVTILWHTFLNFSRWPDDCSKLAQQFFDLGGFPSTAGAIDGCHINVSPPKNDKLSFINRHHSTSLNVLAVAGPDLSFFYVDASAPGRCHDSRVLKESSLWEAFESGEEPFPGAVLIGDSGYGLCRWLMTPFPGNYFPDLVVTRISLKSSYYYWPYGPRNKSVR